MGLVNIALWSAVVVYGHSQLLNYSDMCVICRPHRDFILWSVDMSASSKEPEAFTRRLGRCIGYIYNVWNDVSICKRSEDSFAQQGSDSSSSVYGSCPASCKRYLTARRRNNTTQPLKRVCWETSTARVVVCTAPQQHGGSVACPQLMRLCAHQPRTVRNGTDHNCRDKLTDDLARGSR